MNQLNSLILEGNATRLPDIKEMPNGFKLCKIPLAVNRYYKNSEGKNIQDASFFNVVAFGRLAEFSERNIEIGRGMRIVGRLKQNRWKNSEGKNMSRISIIAEHIEFRPRVKKNTETEDEASIVSDALESDVAETILQEDEVAF